MASVLKLKDRCPSCDSDTLWVYDEQVICLWPECKAPTLFEVSKQMKG